jgi:hypothetical protein
MMDSGPRRRSGFAICRFVLRTRAMLARRNIRRHTDASRRATLRKARGAYFLPLPFSRWLRALAAAVFDVLLVRPSSSVFDAAVAALALVTFFAIGNPASQLVVDNMVRIA